MRPAKSPFGISWCMMPLPAVIHWMSPAPSWPAIAEAVAMLHRAGQHIGDGLDAAMRMPGKAPEIIARIVVAEIVHHQERIGQRRIAEAEDAMQLDAGAFHGRRGNALMLYGTDRHGQVLSAGSLDCQYNHPITVAKLGRRKRTVHKRTLLRCKIVIGRLVKNLSCLTASRRNH